jgi:F0F1-type ATP synthase epsilon subunit
LSDVSEAAEEIDVERAQESRSTAQELISSDSENEEALASLERSEVRLRVGGVEV